MRILYDITLNHNFVACALIRDTPTKRWSDRSHNIREPVRFVIQTIAQLGR